MDFLRNEKTRALLMILVALLVLLVAYLKLDGLGRIIAFFIGGLILLTHLVKLIYVLMVDNKQLSESEAGSVLVKKRKALSLPYLFWPFLFLGFILTAGFVNTAFNHKQYEAELVDLGEAEIAEDLELEPPPTQQKPPPPPPPPPPPEIEIVEDEEIIEEEPEIIDEIVEEETVVEIEEVIPEEPVEEIEEEVFEEPEIFTVVESMPEFPGGDAEMMKWLRKNVPYPKIAKENGIDGLVVVTFVVDERGGISDVQVLRDAGGGLGQAVVNGVKKMPTWTPGKQRGKAVKVQYNLPFRFTLQ